jgi:hypothetical protein
MNYQQLYVWGTTEIDPNYIKRIEPTSQSIIPNDQANADWQAYQEWLAQGNTPLPPA